MKKIKQTLTASLLACTSLNSLHAEAAPWSYGAKLFGNFSSLRGANEEAKVNGKELSLPFMGNFFIAGMGQVGYAFTNYFGIDLGVGYAKMGGKFHAKDTEKPAEGEEDAANTKAVDYVTYAHGITVPVSLCIYPLGREEDGGLLTVMVGPDFYIPLSLVVKEGETDITDKDKLKQLSGLDISFRVGLSYEVLKGVSLEGYGGLGFMNRLNTENNAPVVLFSEKVKNLKTIKTKYVYGGIGVNLAAFFQS